MKHLPCGLPVSTNDPGAVDAFAAGLEAMRDGTDGVAAAMKAALAADPELLLARLAVAELEGRAPHDPGPAPHLCAWELSHLRLALQQHAGRSLAWANDAIGHLGRWPRDTWMFARVHAWAFFEGPASLRLRLGELAATLARSLPDNDYYRARASMALTEAGDPSAGLQILEGVLERRPGALSAWHCKVHALHGLSRHAEAEDVCAAVEGLRGKFDCHMAWHRSLARLTRGDDAGAMALFRSRCGPEVNVGARPIAVADVAGFLWSFALSTGELMDLPSDSVERFLPAGAADHYTVQATAARGAVGTGLVGHHPAVERLSAALEHRDWSAVAPAAREVAAIARPELGGSRLQRAVLALVASVAQMHQGRRASIAELASWIPEAMQHPVLEVELAA